MTITTIGVLSMVFRLLLHIGMNDISVWYHWVYFIVACAMCTFVSYVIVFSIVFIMCVLIKFKFLFRSFELISTSTHLWTGGAFAPSHYLKPHN